MKINVKEIILEVKEEVVQNRVVDGAAVISYYATLATFPALITLIALLTILPIDGLEDFIFNIINQSVPGDTGNLIKKVIGEVLSTKQTAVASFGFLGSLWAASSGMVAVIDQLNFAYNIKETRSYVNKRFLAIVLTVFYMLMMIMASVAILTGSRLLEYSGVHELVFLSRDSIVLDLIRYVLVYSILLLSFASIYYLAPNSKQKFKYVTPGSLIGTTVIIITTLGFDYYVSNITDYNKTYGSLGGVMAYMLWIYISGFVLLLSAEINGSMKKHQVFE